LNGNTTISGANTFSTGTGNLSFNGNIVTNITQTGATNLSTGTGTASLNGNTTLAQGKTLTIAGTNGTASTPITAHYSNTASLNFPAIAQAACSSLTVAVTGARAGDTALATPTAVAGGIETLSIGWFAWVSANDTVTIRACAFQAGDAAAETWRVDVWRH
jgi:hypothetical protein